MDQKLNRRYKFFDEQYWYASTFLKDYFPSQNYRDVHLLEIGSGEGGCLKFFNEQGAKCYGVEMSKDRIQFAIANNRKSIHFIWGDICDRSLSQKLPQMDIIILRDVIEHIRQKEQALKNIKMILNRDGVCFISYPPKYSPYGGHQQNVKNKLGKLPFIHLMPEFLYLIIFKLMKVKSTQINKLLDTKNNMISLQKMERNLSKIGFEIVKKDMYFIRPCYEKRFGIKSRKSIFNKLPIIKEFFTLGALYLLKNDDESIK